MGIDWWGWCVLWDKIVEGRTVRKIQPGFESEEHARSWASTNLTSKHIENVVVARTASCVVDSSPAKDDASRSSTTTTSGDGSTGESFTIVRGDGWDALYVDGVLRVQNGEVGVEDLMDLFEMKDLFDVKYVDDDWLHENESYPQKLSDVKFAE